MRTMTRNRRKFYCASHEAVTMSKDKNGNYIEDVRTYSDPVLHYGVFTPASGQAQIQYFGANEIYDKVITLNLEEDYLVVGSVLWVDTMPELDNKGATETPYDYIVVGVSKSLNFINVAIRKVKVA